MEDRFKNILIASLLLIIAGLLLIFIAAPSAAEYQNQFSSLGLSLIIAGIIAISLDRLSLSAISQELNAVVKRGLNELAIRNYGVLQITPHTPYDEELYPAIRKSRDFVLIQTWSPQMRNILDAVEQMVRSGGTASIFLLNPSCAAAKQRSTDLFQDENHVPVKISRDVAEVQALYRKLYLELREQNPASAEGLKQRLRLFHFSSLPAFAFYKTDSRAWVAFYWLGKQSDAQMNLVIDFASDNQARSHYEEHLKCLMQIAEPVDISNEQHSETPPMIGARA